MAKPRCFRTRSNLQNRLNGPKVLHHYAFLINSNAVAVRNSVRRRHVPLRAIFRFDSCCRILSLFELNLNYLTLWTLKCPPPIFDLVFNVFLDSEQIFRQTKKMTEIFFHEEFNLASRFSLRLKDAEIIFRSPF